MVVTDSSGFPGGCDLEPLRCVPIPILLPDADLVDDASARGPVRRALHDDEPVKTRAPSVVDYLRLVESDDWDAAVVITPAAEFTSMWRNACNAAYLSCRPAMVVDSRSASAGQALAVAAGARVAATGGPLPDVVRATESAARRVRMVAALTSLGQIAGTGFLAQPHLDRVRDDGGLPLFEVADGSIEVVEVVDRRRRPVDALLSLWERRGGRYGEAPLVFEAGMEADALVLAEAVGATSPSIPFSAAMTAYTGTGVIGLAWLG